MGIPRIVPFHRSLIIAFALIVIAVPVIGSFVKAHAFNQVTARSIQMSDSTAGTTGVNYVVSFTTATAGPIEGIVVDFCDNDPVIGDSCNYTNGQSIGLSAATIGAVSGPSSTAFSIASQTSPELALTNGGATTSEPAGTTVSFTISNITNPNYSSCSTGTAPNCTFYARILTYGSPGGATGYTPTNPNGPTDAGGAALSTAANVIVTAKVQEQLNFCVYTGADCAAGGTTVTLGNTQGVLSTVTPYVDKTTKYDVSTNATSGVVIRLKGSTLTSGGTTIPAIGATATASNPGTGQFGLCSYVLTGVTLSVAAPYNDTNCSGTTQTAGTPTGGGDNGALFAFNSTNTSSTYGDEIATDAAGANSTGTIAFMGNIGISQIAGIYTTALTFIATGTY